MAAVHAEAATSRETDGPQTAVLYGDLARVSPSPFVELNRAVAVATGEGDEAELELVEGLEGLGCYSPFHGARAALLARTGRADDVAAAHRRALELAPTPTEQRHLGAPSRADPRALGRRVSDTVSDRNRSAVAPSYYARATRAGLSAAGEFAGVEQTFGGYFSPATPPPGRLEPSCWKDRPPPWARWTRLSISKAAIRRFLNTTDMGGTR